MPPVPPQRNTTIKLQQAPPTSLLCWIWNMQSILTLWGAGAAVAAGHPPPPLLPHVDCPGPSLLLPSHPTLFVLHDVGGCALTEEEEAGAGGRVQAAGSLGLAAPGE
eukprot:2590239-Rhodomonas_salina.1